MNLRACDQSMLRMAFGASQFSLFGCAMNFLSNIPAYQGEPLESSARFIKQGLGCSQIKLLFDETNSLAGMIVWAWVTSQTQNRLISQNGILPDLHANEWREGPLLQVLTVVAYSGGAWAALRSFREQFAKDCIYWVNRDGRLVCSKPSGGL